MTQRFVFDKDYAPIIYNPNSFEGYLGSRMVRAAVEGLWPFRPASACVFETFDVEHDLHKITVEFRFPAKTDTIYGSNAYPRDVLFDLINVHDGRLLVEDMFDVFRYWFTIDPIPDNVILGEN